MPRFEPFPGLRYDTGAVDLEAVIAPPYDVLSDEDRATYAGRDPHNIVHVDVPLEAEGPARYEHAAAALRQWEGERILTRDPAPSFTLYRMRYTADDGRHRDTVGVIGALEVVDEGAGGVLRHERTTPKAATDRLELTRATSANLSPIWGLSLTPRLTDLLLEPGDPIGTVVDDDGVTHTVERVTDAERSAAIAAAVSSSPVLIADGHHRYEVSRLYRDERRGANGGAPGPYDLTMAYIGELVEDQLSVEPIHRLLDGLPADHTWPNVLEPWFTLEPLGPADPMLPPLLVERDVLALVDADGLATLLHPRPQAFEGLRDLDSVRLERALVDVPHTERFQHGLDHVLVALSKGLAQAAILTRPVSLREIRRTADEHLLMPPKSTFFTPKLRTGLVMRPLA